MITMRPNHQAFQRIRTRAEALKLTNGDRQTVILRLLDSVHNTQVREAFRSKGATVATGPWPEWSPKYAKWRAKHRGRIGMRMMRLTDSLYEKSTSPNHGAHIARWNGSLSYSFGFRDDVGFIHQNGGPIIPKRSILDKTKTQYQEFVAALVTFWRARIRQILRHT